MSLNFFYSLLGKRNKAANKVTEHADEAVKSDQYEAFREGWINGGIRIGVGTTVLAQCINQADCDLVICVDLCFNLVTYLQASSRGGRSQQRSLSLFLYRVNVLTACLQKEIDFNQQRFWGVNVETPSVRRALSTESLVPFVQHKFKNHEVLCRRLRITEEIDAVPPGESDNSIPVNVIVPVDWCCDICSKNIALIRRELLLVGAYSTPPRVASTATTYEDWEDSPPPQDCDNSAVVELSDHLSGPDGSHPTPLTGVSPSPSMSATSSSVTPNQTGLRAPPNPYAASRIIISQPQHPTQPISRSHAASTSLTGVSITPSPLMSATPSSVTPNQTGLRSPPNPYAASRIIISQSQDPTQPISRSHAAASVPVTPRADIGDNTTQYPDDGSASFVNGAVTTIPPMISTANKHSSACPLQAFVTLQDRRLLTCCAWHGSARRVPVTKPHTLPITLTIHPFSGSTSCRTAFISFLGRKGSYVCYRCGDSPHTCRTASHDINTCRMKRFKFNPNYCAFCGVHNDVGELHSHQIKRCPQDRLWFVIIWAFRSEQGHRSMSQEWNVHSGARMICGVVDYPLIVPFGGDRTDWVALARDWTECLAFLVRNESHNRQFWRCMISVLEKRGSITPL